MVHVNNRQVVPAQETSGGSTSLVLSIIRDTTNPDHTARQFTRNLPATTTLEGFHTELAEQCRYRPGTFSVVWSRDGKGGSDEVELTLDSNQTLASAGMKLDGQRNFLEIRDKDGQQPISIEVEGAEGGIPLQPMGPSREPGDGASCHTQETHTSDSETYASAVSKPESEYVGLVNQAMTCYLNSLLQTLYMTPEFRNAIYRWEYQECDETHPTRYIPYQLQRLFVQLQTSYKRSVETTELTRSFGWDSSEAWQQHDVQELCRVMFDALEQTWKNTDQANVINKLYQGRLKDYVKCQECGNESARKDFFLDIPLVIRPFGSEKAYGSVEEAIEAFVSPETLDGNNQYSCEKCNKKCDAHKGLKFLSFPYLLTLQLKRFDFDYNTLQRIKLNDKMTFPEILDLNNLVEGGNEDSPNGKHGNESQSDSGAENEDSDPSNANSDEVDDGIDEGIDVEHAGPDTNTESGTRKGPYIYKLFSIMVHSGTASGGHYYAYICNFENDKWYCFNDQQVTRITQEDIKKTYGGASSGYSGFYFSSYSSSTNAYMLMYRRVEPGRNAGFLPEEKFPEHLKNLVQRIQDEEEYEKRAKEIERNTCKIKLFGFHPTTDKLQEVKLEVHRDKTLQEATEMAHRLLEYEGAISVDRCRLVKYDEFHENIEQSFDDPPDTPIGIILGGVKSPYMFDLFLETREADQEFESYRTGGASLRVYQVNLADESIDSPVRTRVYLNMTVADLREKIAQMTGTPVESLRMVLEKYYDDPKLLIDSAKTLRSESFNKSNKLFIECGVDNEDRSIGKFSESKLFRLLDQQANTIRVYVTLPPKPNSDTSPSQGESTLSSASNDSVQSVQECFPDLELDSANLSPNNLPTPSPTGSTSTLSDDQPLDKNSVNLVGSETDSGVVSLHEARISDEGRIGDDPRIGEGPELGNEGREESQAVDDLSHSQGHRVKEHGDIGSSSGMTDRTDAQTDTRSDPKDIVYKLQNLQESDLARRRENPGSLRYSEGGPPVSECHPSREHLSLPLVSQSGSDWEGDQGAGPGWQKGKVSVTEWQKDHASTSNWAEEQASGSGWQEGQASGGGAEGGKDLLEVPVQEDWDEEISGENREESRARAGGSVMNERIIEGSAQQETSKEDCGDDSDSFTPAWQHSNWYFKVEEEREEDGDRVLIVYLDKRMMLGYFKECLKGHVGTFPENFKVYRVYANSQEFESIRLNETLSSYNDDSQIKIKHGRALKKGEYRVKMYLLSPKENEPCKFLFEWVLAKGMTVEESKHKLLPAICEKIGIKSPTGIERLRLRQKVWKNPGSVYLNEKVYDEDIPIFTSWEAFAEILDEPERLRSSQQLLLFTKLWRPSELKVDSFREVILDECTIVELKRVLSEQSGIPADDVEIAKGRGTFPCEVSVLEMQTELDWNPRVETLGEWPLYINDDGAVLYYRDRTEEVKELTEEEKQEIKKSESARFGGSQPKTNYISPRKERALKIHLYLPPDKNTKQ